MSFFVLRLKENNPFFNLSLEEYIFSTAPKNDSDIYLLFYENSDSIILGKNLIMEKEVYKHKILPPVIRRSSGGGSVVHFPGNLNFGLIVNVDTHSEFQNIQKSYEIIMGKMAASLSGRIKFMHNGISDLCVVTHGGNRKVSGNSQVRKKKWLLHHGTLLFSTHNLKKISYYLKHPPKEPEYRQGKKHKDFMIRHMPHMTSNQLIQKIVPAFSDYFQQPAQIMPVTLQLKKEARNYFNLKRESFILRIRGTSCP